MKKTCLLFVTLIITAFFITCNNITDKPKTDSELLSVIIVSNETALTGETLTFTADNQNNYNDISVSWLIKSKPEDSTADITPVDNKSMTITFDKKGIYNITVTVKRSSGASRTVSKKITVFEISTNTIFVDLSYSGDDSDGTEARPFKTIQDGIDNADSGDTIKVAEGNYNENLCLKPDLGVLLYGGYQSGDFGVRDYELYPTIITGSNTSPVIEFLYNGGSTDYQVVEIDGFTITGGKRGVNLVNSGNGGIALARVSNNIIDNNNTPEVDNLLGGGINISDMIAVVSNNRISSNRATKAGGLNISFYTTEYSITVENNIIENNEIYSDHGAGTAIHAYKGIIKNNIFRNNRILEDWGWGGGLFINGNQFTGFTDDIYIELSGNVYYGNMAPTMGSGLFIDEGANVRMKNELIYKNTTNDADRNGPLYVDGLRGTANARTEGINITIADNTGFDGASGNAVVVEGGSYVYLRNSIFYNNHSGSNATDFVVSNTEDRTSSLTISYSTYNNGYSGNGTFNITYSDKLDPLFADNTNDDYHLRSITGRWDDNTESWTTDSDTSPAIDAGKPSDSYSLEPLPNGYRVNRGAYGNTAEASKS